MWHLIPTFSGIILVVEEEVDTAAIVEILPLKVMIIEDQDVVEVDLWEEATLEGNCIPTTELNKTKAKYS